MPKKHAQSRKRPKPRARGKEVSPQRQSPTVAAKVPGADAPAESGLVIAGVGASAGGLEAFSQVLQALPDDPGLSIVLVQHLAPQHESALPVLLSGRTHLQVEQAAEGMRVERNRVYVIPPNVQMGIQNDVLHLLPRPSDRTQYTPIDYFLRSLAESAQDRAIGVILSGTASDGTAGVREIKAVGGITIAQSPDTAKYDGMPRAAIASNFIDLVLTPPDIAAELVSIARHPLKQARPQAATSESAREDLEATPDQQMEQVFSLLRSSSGVDFRSYRRPTIERRLHRRMVLQKLTSLEQYIRYLRDNPAELHALYGDILIHVTRFFRDREAFTALTTQVLPELLKRQSDDQAIRVWVPGCSTGEEAYSVAIAILESLAEQNRSVPIQVFATDISEPSIEHARAGIYPESIAADVTQERLRRFFAKVEGGYRINKVVRDACIFARQDLTRDPPFSKLDLILCRNVLIYLGVELQKRLMRVLHYALKPNGFLILGAAETIGSSADLFATTDRKYRIYQKKAGSSADLGFQPDHPMVDVVQPRRPATPTRGDTTRTVDAEATRIIQERYAPPGAVVDANLNVVQFRGQTGVFLEPAPGEPSLNILKLARDGLLHGLRDALQQARKTRTTVRKRGLRVRVNGGWREVDLEILPLIASDRSHFLVLFDEVTGGASKYRARRDPVPTAGSEPAASREPRNRRVNRLERELASSREYLQSIIQDLEAANEELQSANEEVLSANEELQSTNEELDTAKEELQSTNEELNTVNEELHGRNEELSRVNSDLVNLLSSVQIAIVIVASDLRIRRFTPMAERVLNLIPGDVGRPISHIKPNIDCPDLEDLIAEVVDTVTPCEREVRDAQGNALSLRIRPYKNLENRIDGAVLALFEVHGDESHEDAARRAYECATTVMDAAHEPMLLLGDELRVRGINRAFSERFNISAAAARGKPVYELADGQWNIDRLRSLLEGNGVGTRSVDSVEIEPDFLPADRRRLAVNARRLSADGEREPLLLLTFAEHGDRGRRSAE